MDWMVDVGMGTEESAQAVGRAEASGGHVVVSVGIHPNDLTEFDADEEATMARLRTLAGHRCVVAIGETGMDRYRTREPVERQERAFRAHIQLAKQLDRALVIHCRDAHDDVLRVLDDEGAPGRVVMHCFSGDVAHARACADRGFACSFAGNLTYPRNDELRDAASVLPASSLLVETDAPYLSPQPVRSKRNEPAFVGHTAEVLASVRGLAADDLVALVAENAERTFAVRR